MELSQCGKSPRQVHRTASDPISSTRIFTVASVPGNPKTAVEPTRGSTELFAVQNPRSPSSVETASTISFGAALVSVASTIALSISSSFGRGPEGRLPSEAIVKMWLKHLATPLVMVLKFMLK